ncbi:MAG: beta-galactosidase [Bacteroidales bacterium]|nr:beta-galactosidase [Bacteroidales bacterium]
MTTVSAQISRDEVPMIGAELFIEPGQTPDEMNTWFQRMKEGGMTITRIRMFETYMHKPDGTWDFSLFDQAFMVAEKFNIKVYANLFPATSFSDLGGFKFPRDEEHLTSISEYIKNLVPHFKEFSSLYGWVPINEPGIDGIPEGIFTQNKFKEWRDNQPANVYNSKGFEHFNFEDDRFLLDYNTWFLKWLIDEIRKYDQKSPIHVNTHAIFNNITVYDFPEWSKFLTSLGGSAHASWHFGYFKRNQYGAAMSANGEIIRSGAGKIPWLMTELQGGNNTYSGGNPMCPTKEEISQWLWTIIGTESKGAIFWCLNPKSSGIEAGEWALLNFQNEPSDRMEAVSKVTEIVNKNTSLFAKARIPGSGISVLYSREALWVEKKLQTGSNGPYEGRNAGGVMKSALSYFEALGEMGIQSDLKEFSEYDFSKSDFTGASIILAHQIAIHSRYWQNLYGFVDKGGKLIVDELTSYFDENALCVIKWKSEYE